ncbi:hypothetical protein [uncultured Phocaeicola sp.]|uniref:glycosyltransferase n=1 Tax=uncultured Phocaeicola sp. TaxID=990718 RepID=UPI0025D41ADF|nr:hypothetical protein [uncultured Phocaeicola sp.]
MNITCITGYTPTPENKRGISALIYWLINGRPEYVHIKLYTYNINDIPDNEIYEIANQLKIEIYKIDLPYWYKKINKSFLNKFTDLFQIRPLITYIRPDKKILKELEKSDAIWIYPYFFYNYAKLLPHKTFIITGCDCLSNVCTTRISDLFYLKKYFRGIRQFLIRYNCTKLEKEFNRPNITMHYVGMSDLMFYKRLHKADNAFFLLHPHYGLKNKDIRFNTDKLDILIAGEYNHYMICDTDEMVEEMIHLKDLQKLIKITFLGKNWEKVKETLVNAGYDCEHKKWVNNYAEEIIKHDVQISPISHGAGTKGKVLDSIGNGLLTIGSKYALENICVRHKESCILYKYASEIPAILRSIALNKERYENMAQKGRSQILKYHNPTRISKRFFEIISKKI